MACDATYVQSLRDRIAALESRLDAGVKRTTSDGVTTEFADGDEVRRRLAELRGQLAAAYGGRPRRFFSQPFRVTGGGP